MKQLARYFMTLILIAVIAACNDGGGGEDSQAGSRYFPLEVGNSWEYEVEDDGNIYELRIEITDISDDGYYQLSVTEDGAQTAIHEVKESDGRVITRNDKIVVPRAGETVAVTDMVFLFTRYYSPDTIADSMTFVNDGDLIRAEYVASPSFTYNTLNTFGIEFQKDVGMYRFTDQKYFDNPFWGTETYIGSGLLTWTNI